MYSYGNILLRELNLISEKPYYQVQILLESWSVVKGDRPPHRNHPGTEGQRTFPMQPVGSRTCLKGGDFLTEGCPEGKIPNHDLHRRRLLRGTVLRQLLTPSGGDTYSTLQRVEYLSMKHSTMPGMYIG